MAVILRYFSEFVYLPGVLRKSSRSLSHLLMSSCKCCIHTNKATIMQLCDCQRRQPKNIYARWTFDCCSELVESVEADRVEHVVRLERHAEEVSVGYFECTSGHHVISAQRRHLAVDHGDVEVREEYVITLRLLLQTPVSVHERLAATLCGSRPGVQSASLIMTSLMTS